MIEEILKVKGEIWVKVEGMSMDPLIKNGEKVLVRKANIREILPGDMILYSAGSYLVTHRAVGKFCCGDWYLLERGENGGSIGRVKGDSILGKVVAIEKGRNTFNVEKICEEWRKVSGKGYALLTFIYALSFKIKHLLGINSKRLKSSFFHLFLAFERKLHKKAVFKGGNVERS